MTNIPEWMPKTVKELKPVKGIEEYARKQYDEVFIFYKRRKVYAECLCSECGGIYLLRTHETGDPFEDAAIDIEKPVRMAKTKCRLCNRKGLYATAGKFETRWHEQHICVGEKISDTRFVFRIFYTEQILRRNRPAQYVCNERRRIFTEKGKKAVKYEFHNIYGWMKSTVGDFYRYYAHPKTFREIKKTGMYKYVPVPEKFKDRYYDDSWVMDFYIAAARYPDLEMIIKLGMDDLARGLIDQMSVNFNPRGHEIHDRLRVNKNRLPELIEQKGDGRTLRLYQTERRLKKNWTPEELEIVKLFYRQYYESEYVKALKYMSPIRLMNYMKKNKIWFTDKYDRKRADRRKEYFDYIDMREKLGYDMTDDIILFPKDIRRRHHEMVMQSEKEAIDKRAREVLEKFPNIEKMYEKLSDTYSAAAAGLMIRPARNAAEIVTEGRILHHCVGASNTYLSRHNDGRGFILFLRKTKEPDIPYITVEIEGTVIKQWYGEYDSKPDRKYYDAWLAKYVKELKKHTEKKSKQRQKTAKTA